MKLSKKNLADRQDHVYDAIAVADGTLAATAIWRDIRRESPPRLWAEHMSGQAVSAND